MPTLFRFFSILVLLGLIVFAAMFALATFVKPEPREIVEILPPAKLQPK